MINRHQYSHFFLNLFLINFFVSGTLKTDINKCFLDACENGDYSTVILILETLREFNIDVTDSLGRTGLRLAVENEHLEVNNNFIT